MTIPVKPMLISSNLRANFDRWDDPGGYPNTVAGNALPSFDYVAGITGDLLIFIPSPFPRKKRVLTAHEIQERNPLLSEVLSEVWPLVQETGFTEVEQWLIEPIEKWRGGIVFKFSVESFKEIKTWMQNENQSSMK